MKKTLILFGLLHKRLLKKASFLAIALLIPCLTALMSLSFSEQRGFVHIAISGKQSDDALTRQVLSDIPKDTDLVRFTLCEGEDEALQLYRKGKVDGAWILEADLQNRMARLIDGEREILAHVYAPKEDTMVRAAGEKLFGALYVPLGDMIYEKYVHRVSDKDYTAQQLEEIREKYVPKEKLVEMVSLDADLKPQDAPDYLTAPLRGLLMVLMLCGGLAAAIYFAEDEKQGTFAAYSPSRRFVTMFLNQLAALNILALCVSAALYFSGNYVSFWRESALMIGFVLSAAAFCTWMECLFTTPSRLSVTLPLILLFGIAASPIFFNTRILLPLQYLLPLRSYLYGVEDISQLFVTVAQFIGLTVCGYGIYQWKNHPSSNKKER